MWLDQKAKLWAKGCAIAGLILTALFYGTMYFFPHTERLCHSLAGLLSTMGIFFCSSLQWVKWLPMSFRKRLQPYLDNGHPWIGLLTALLVTLHTKWATVGLYFNFARMAHLVFLSIVLSGVITFFLHHLLILMKDAKGSPKKEMAGLLIFLTYDLVKMVHEVLHYLLYVLIGFHVYGYFCYGRFW